jgi:hypothetical protein
MGDVDLVWVRCFQWKGRDVFTLARESTPVCWLTAADVRDILGDEPPVIAYDDSGPGGALIFPFGSRTAVMLRDQLNDALRSDDGCPAESFPEPGAPADVDADDFAEPAGGESARVAAEEAAHLDTLRAKAAATEDVIYYGWKSGDRFEIGPVDDVSRSWAAGHLWMTWGGATRGAVVCRCDVQVSGHSTTPGLLIECEGLRRATVVDPRVLSVCARKVL